MSNTVAETPQIHYVYAMESDCFPGLIKIGRTKDIKKRLQSGMTFNAPNPFRLLFSAKTLDSFRDEKITHSHFSKQRECGEFFRVTADEVKTFFDTEITPIFEKELAEWKLPPQKNYDNFLQMIIAGTIDEQKREMKRKADQMDVVQADPMYKKVKIPNYGDIVISVVDDQMLFTEQQISGSIFKVLTKHLDDVYNIIQQEVEEDLQIDKKKLEDAEQVRLDAKQREIDMELKKQETEIELLIKRLPIEERYAELKDRQHQNEMAKLEKEIELKKTTPGSAAAPPTFPSGDLTARKTSL